MKLIIENVRSFAGRHEYDVRPLTLLVGENSSGKSTFLASLAAVSDSVSFPSIAILNKPPYDLGTFDTIATYKGGRSGRARSFSLGYKSESPEGNSEIEVKATFCSEDGESRLSELQFEEGDVTARISLDRDKATTRFQGVKNLPAIEAVQVFEPQQLSTMTFGALASLVSTSLFSRNRKIDQKSFSRLYNQLFHYTRRWGASAPRATSIAPIRSEPKRTYDRLGEEFNPSGDHVPFVLARMFQDEDSKKNRALLDAVVAFGNDSGLFQKINVKRLGTKAGDPFQVQISVGGPPVNLADVGYGVNQSLPIIVESVLRASGSRILLQQPEVHLHPRAQAALGSFFAKLVADQNQRFVIETHSDYLIDRVRQEVAAGNLSKDAVRILFFDRPHIETTVSELTLDKYGNVQSAPLNYRDFFLHEELKLLARAE